MKTRFHFKRRGISPLLATILLIALVIVGGALTLIVLSGIMFQVEPIDFDIELSDFRSEDGDERVDRFTIAIENIRTNPIVVKQTDFTVFGDTVIVNTTTSTNLEENNFESSLTPTSNFGTWISTGNWSLNTTDPIEGSQKASNYGSGIDDYLRFTFVYPVNISDIAFYSNMSLASDRAQNRLELRAENNTIINSWNGTVLTDSDTVRNTISANEQDVKYIQWVANGSQPWDLDHISINEDYFLFQKESAFEELTGWVVRGLTGEYTISGKETLYVTINCINPNHELVPRADRVKVEVKARNYDDPDGKGKSQNSSLILLEHTYGPIVPLVPFAASLDSFLTVNITNYGTTDLDLVVTARGPEGFLFNNTHNADSTTIISRGIDVTRALNLENDLLPPSTTLQFGSRNILSWWVNASTTLSPGTHFVELWVTDTSFRTLAFQLIAFPI